MPSSGELLTSCLGSMKHHFDYREPFQDDLLHQNHQHRQRNIFWLPFSLWSHMCCYPSCSSAQYTGGWVRGCKYVLFICYAGSEVCHRWFAVFPTPHWREWVQRRKGHSLDRCNKGEGLRRKYSKSLSIQSTSPSLPSSPKTHSQCHVITWNVGIVEQGFTASRSLLLTCRVQGRPGSGCFCCHSYLFFLLEVFWKSSPDSACIFRHFSI